MLKICQYSQIINKAMRLAPAISTKESRASINA